MNTLKKQLKHEKLLPLYTSTNLSMLPLLEDVLVENEINFIEIAYRSELASQAIKKLAISNKLIVGAGTVCDLRTAKDAINNGAKFIVMPGINEEVIEFCLENNILVVPGSVTPTEIIQAKNLGLDTVKFFPANIYGGIAALKALSGPFPEINFVPTGGVTNENYIEYLNLNSVLAVGGSFIISEKSLENDNGISAKENLQKITASIHNTNQ
ncbi:bifunctional 4-hydroxy-2-oxoglutarate aldolase/2-dehydro-3-deoxy-phosphogluconate aldolase [Ignavigranum ruoffiae]|uniref:bifunctional 4-hydroxy-2-oxoglutarate aldolase/2-dehydro-3-deoxy-phosphogluconate aldolase n=1 Tax=Ignavigranum ruoffiae TaxID=89093 RepID=UPI0020511BBD|nr:bifunctional 4-hydroxy-2-oxoglutarate aldolase/2-dehydro-3-deoxy-phosphogluconate aldolase [Ignavigranum ruoffiae]UPQ86605.1 bifunctional 4-hydroxy-2-oxoglutarate aldolase/2-dehydro-3-deoxy-phosphogluconate aldolase [Ignavigranum ruoffiae]